MTLESDRALAERLVRAAGGIALELRGVAAPRSRARADRRRHGGRPARGGARCSTCCARSGPDDGVLGEEGAAVAAGGARRWVLDPVDGTLNYARGMPGLVLGGRAPRRRDGPLACAVLRPGARRALQRGARARARRSTGAPLRVGGAPALASASVAMFVDVRRRDAGGRAPNERARWAGRLAARRRLRLARARLGRRGPARRAGCSPTSEPWDWHPGALLVARGGRGRAGARALVRGVALAGRWPASCWRSRRRAA